MEISRRRFVSSSAAALGVAAAPTLRPAGRASAQMADAAAPIRGGSLLRNVRIPMRDGVRLEGHVFLPAGKGPFPVVLVRTAYNRMGFATGEPFISRGLAIMAQDCRGRYGSEGVFYPFVNEGRDGQDTLAWIAAQPWCNGRIGMFGNSYLAATQFYAAIQRSEHLKALNPRFMAGDLWRNAYYLNGAFTLALTWSWLCLEVDSRVSNAALLPRFDLERLLRELPLLTIDEKTGSGPVPAYRDYVRHFADDRWWQALNVRRHAQRFTMPVLLTGGWYDYYAGETFENYRALVEQAPSKELAASHRVIVGPWTHGISSQPLGQLEFGAARSEEDDATLRWLACILHGRSAVEFQAAPIRIFVMGVNRWRDEHEWPLARTRWTRFYLHSDAAANSLLGNGRLSLETPAEQRPDHYTYDPANPVPTLGGNHSVGPYNPGLYEMARPGPYDQRPIERRDDVLVYTSDVLDEDLEVTGPVEMQLFVASSAPDTDFVARLTDVYPDGRSMNLTEGVLRCRFRDDRWSDPQPMQPGRVYRLTVRLHPTSSVFFRGHRLRLQITSSNFPLWDRNPNTGEPTGLGTSMRRAEQTVLHDAQHPSHVVLPVIPPG